jgi:hypothetical protein
MNRNARPYKVKSAKRVLVWWDVDVFIGAFHKRKLTARPLKFLERALGHRVRVESRSRYKNMPPGVWKLEAYHYLDTDDPALAAYLLLIQTSKFSEQLAMSWQGFNTAVTTLSDDPDHGTVCAFYWHSSEPMPGRVYSGGVMLKLVDAEHTAFHPHQNRISHRQRLSRPVIQVPPAPTTKANYEVAFTVHIFSSDKQDLLEFHWPRFQVSKWPNGIDHFDIVPPTHVGEPNTIIVRQTLRQMQEHEAIAHCLSYAQSFRIVLNREGVFRLSGERQNTLDGKDGIVSFEMMQVPLL